MIDLPPELSPAKLALSPPIEATSLVLYWSPLGPGGTAAIEIQGGSHPLVEGTPLSVDFAEPTALTEVRVLVAEGNPGIRIDDVEVDLNPIGLKAAYFIVPSQVPSEIQTVESLGCWSVHQGVQVEDPGTGQGASGFFRKDAAEIAAYEPERVEIATRSPREGFVVLSDTYRPGWSAFVDGEEAPILRAQTAFRAVPVPAGEHRILFLYRPWSLRAGTAVSLVSLLILAAWPLVRRFRRRGNTPIFE
jgi:hypothetical protein